MVMGKCIWSALAEECVAASTLLVPLEVLAGRRALFAVVGHDWSTRWFNLVGVAGPGLVGGNSCFIIVPSDEEAVDYRVLGTTRDIVLGGAGGRGRGGGFSFPAGVVGNVGAVIACRCNLSIRFSKPRGAVRIWIYDSGECGPVALLRGSVHCRRCWYFRSWTLLEKTWHRETQ